MSVFFDQPKRKMWNSSWKRLNSMVCCWCYINYIIEERFLQIHFFKSSMYFYLHLVKIQAWLSFFMLFLKKILYDWCSDKSELCIFTVRQLRFAALFSFGGNLMQSKTDTKKCGTCHYWAGNREPAFRKDGKPVINIYDDVGMCMHGNSNFSDQLRKQTLCCKCYSKWTELLWRKDF